MTLNPKQKDSPLGHIFSRSDDNRLKMEISRNTALMMPRGFSKTTLVNAAILYLICYQEAEFTLYISETKINFTQMLGAIPNIGMSGAELMDKLTNVELNRPDVLNTLPPDAAAQAHQLMAHFDKLAVAINTGTNIPSVATPNGQAAFLFLLTSALAPVIRLSYGRMVYLALPYTITMSLTGLAAVYLFL